MNRDTSQYFGFHNVSRTFQKTKKPINMIDKTTFHRDRLDFNGNQKVKIRGYLVVLICNLIVLNSTANKEITMTTMVIMSLCSISCLLLIFLLAFRDNSKDTLIKEIKYIKLKVNLTGIFIVRIKNKKGKVRIINLGKNHIEVSKYLDFANSNNLQIDFDEKILAHIEK